MRVRVVMGGGVCKCAWEGREGRRGAEGRDGQETWVRRGVQEGGNGGEAEETWKSRERLGGLAGKKINDNRENGLESLFRRSTWPSVLEQDSEPPTAPSEQTSALFDLLAPLVCECVDRRRRDSNPSLKDLLYQLSHSHSCVYQHHFSFSYCT